jgi:hypothetical protein
MKIVPEKEKEAIRGEKFGEIRDGYVRLYIAFAIFVPFVGNDVDAEAIQKFRRQYQRGRQDSSRVHLD